MKRFAFHIALAICFAAPVVADELASNAPVHPLSAAAPVQEWLLLGPFPNPDPVNPQPGADYRAGHHADYLSALGGESAAAIAPDSVATYQDATGATQSVSACKAHIDAAHKIDFKAHYPQGKGVAYAFAQVHSEKDQPAYCYFAFNDGAKLFVNGEQVFAFYNSKGRALADGQELIPVNLRAGHNAILVKVEDAGGRYWEFTFAILDEAGRAKKTTTENGIEDLRQFQKTRLVPEQGGFVLSPGPFPKIGWENPNLVQLVMGDFALQTTWYHDAGKGKRVRIAKAGDAAQPGRYAAVLDGTTANGTHIRRELTFYCVPQNWTPPLDALAAYINALPVAKEFKEPWMKVVDGLVPFEALSEQGFGNESTAILLASFDKVHTAKGLGVLDTPEDINDDFHFALRAKLTGAKLSPKLKPPHKKSGAPAPVLREGTPADAGMAPDTADKLRAVCEDWLAAGKQPMVTLVARHGVIVYHEGVGADIHEPMWLASITKAVSGILFAQFVDQGLIGVDQPIGDFLPDFPKTGEKTITMRNLFTHTTGLSGHGEWGGILNPSLDNIVANGLPYLRPGLIREYNGMGYDLAGVVMQAAARKPIFRLFHENYFGPLGITNTSISHMGHNCYATAFDLARIAQLLANRGSYGGLEFFSPEAFEAIQPKPLEQFYPSIHDEWGFGLVRLRYPDPRAGKDGTPPDATLLGKNVMGHGAASGAIFLVDLDHDLIVAQVRDERGANYDEYASKFIQAVHDCLMP
ncbi:MAG TPA: serine hydrolase domain-containing protein [Candidatus Hydrogenedentes bacterium]|nr:serine hydrolase domain-containing protein [Candidatus Hydrogenedentota bacterium]